MNAICLYRVARWAYLRRIPFIPTMMRYLTFLLYNSHIPCTAEIGKFTKFGYGGMGVVIHSKAKIGANCVIAQQVTIGGRSKIQTVPVIEDNVYIGAGAKVLGNVVIGAGSVIGANAVVIKSIPPRSIAVGVPARVIKTNINIEDYV